MKRELLKDTIYGVILGCILASGMVLVNAELTGESKVVTVGNSDAPVYSYELDMNNFGVFDWVYNNETDAFEWTDSCKAYLMLGNDTVYNTYSDTKCTNYKSSQTLNEGDYYYKKVSNEITIKDTSTYGKIKADVEYVPEEYYRWTGMEIVTSKYECIEQSLNTNTVDYPIYIHNYYSDSTCSNFYEQNVAFTIGVDHAYTYVNNSFTNISDTTALYESYPTSYTSNALFNDAGLYYTANDNGATGTALTYDDRNAILKFNPVIINLVDESQEEFITPQSGNIMGTLTVNIHEDV